MLKVIIIFALAIICNASANVLMKVGMKRVGDGGTLVQTITGAVTQPFVWAGVVSFALALVFYSVVLSKINLSIAYPLMVSLGLIIVILSSYFFLTETIKWVQIIGFLLIIAGVWLVSR
jgi:multidrug transporter EmrE-like cation transporter